jgi:hypothetical protein
MKLLRHFDSPIGRIGSAESLVVSVYRGNASIEMLDSLDALQSELILRHPKLSTLGIITNGMAMLKVDDSIRARSVHFSKKYEHAVLGSAIALTARGPTGVMVRAFMSGFFLLSKPEMPVKTFSTVREGLLWLQQLPGQEIDVKSSISLADVERFIEQ